MAESSEIAPDACPHRRLQRLGIQELGVWPHRVHLVVCADCGTTLTTESLRRPRREERKRRGRSGGAEGS
jgi:hypothetical protein